jgi:hypothetical protein
MLKINNWLCAIFVYHFLWTMMLYYIINCKVTMYFLKMVRNGTKYKFTHELAWIIWMEVSVRLFFSPFFWPNSLNDLWNIENVDSLLRLSTRSSIIVDLFILTNNYISTYFQNLWYLSWIHSMKIKLKQWWNLTPKKRGKKQPNTNLHSDYSC